MHSGSVLAQALGCCSLTRVVQNQPERQKFVQNPQKYFGPLVNLPNVIDITVKIIAILV